MFSMACKLPATACSGLLPAITVHVHPALILHPLPSPSVCTHPLPLPLPLSPMDCAPKAPTVEPGSMRLASYRLVHCSTNPDSSAAVTPTVGEGSGVGYVGASARMARTEQGQAVTAQNSLPTTHHDLKQAMPLRTPSLNPPHLG